MIYVQFCMDSLHQHLIDAKVAELVSVDEVLQYAVDEDIINNFESLESYCKIFPNTDQHSDEIEVDDLEEHVLSIYTKSAVDLAEMTQCRKDWKDKISAYLESHRDDPEHISKVARFLDRIHYANIIFSNFSTVLPYTHTGRLFGKVTRLLAYLGYSEPVQLFAVLDTLTTTGDVSWQWGISNDNYVSIDLKFTLERLETFFPDTAVQAE